LNEESQEVNKKQKKKDDENSTGTNNKNSMSEDNPSTKPVAQQEEKNAVTETAEPQKPKTQPPAYQRSLESDIQNAITKQRDLILTTVVEDNVNVFKLWYKSLVKLGLEKHVFIFSNSATAPMLKEANYNNVVYFKNDRGYPLIVQKHMFLSLLLQRKVNVLLASCNAYWLKNPLAFIHSPHEHDPYSEESKPKPGDIIGLQRSYNSPGLSFSLAYFNNTDILRNVWRQAGKSNLLLQLKRPKFSAAEEDSALNKFIKGTELTLQLFPKQSFPPSVEEMEEGADIQVLNNLDAEHIEELYDAGLLHEDDAT